VIARTPMLASGRAAGVPRPSISAAIRATAAGSRPLTTTSAPRRARERAVARPRPRVAHFADKEDFLFAKDAELHAAMARAAADVPADATPAAILSRATRAVAELVEPDRELLVRRARVTARTPALQAREGMKHAAMQQLFVDELVRRGHRREKARLVAGIGIACVIEALTRWLDDPAAGSLVHALDGVEAEVRALVL
jgi:hypothetical protein